MKINKAHIVRVCGSHNDNNIGVNVAVVWDETQLTNNDSRREYVQLQLSFGVLEQLSKDE
jgi:hypothetical protein